MGQVFERMVQEERERRATDAVRENQPEVLRDALADGRVSPNLGMYALMPMRDAPMVYHAIKAGFTEVVRVLLDAGVDVHQWYDFPVLDGNPPRVWSLMDMALWVSAGEVAELLLARGYDWAAHPEPRRLWGFVAQANGEPSSAWTEVLASMREAGLDAWLEAPNANGETPLQEATRTRFADLGVGLLVRQGASLEPSEPEAPGFHALGQWIGRVMSTSTVPSSACLKEDQLRWVLTSFAARRPSVVGIEGAQAQLEHVLDQYTHRRWDLDAADLQKQRWAEEALAHLAAIRLTQEVTDPQVDPALRSTVERRPRF